MRSWMAGILTTALLLTAAAPASALPSTDDLVNWTETWINGNYELEEFTFDEDSEYSLGAFDTPVINFDAVLAGTQVLGTIITVTLPNFFDPLPEKNIYIAFEGGNGGAQGNDFPFVTSIIGSDSEYPGGGGSVPVFGSLVDGSVMCTSMLCEQEWLIEPNPDFETITAFIPTAFEFTSMHIVTQSVPEPGVTALFGIGVLGLAMAGRRRA